MCIRDRYIGVSSYFLFIHAFQTFSFAIDVQNKIKRELITFHFATYSTIYILAEVRCKYFTRRRLSCSSANRKCFSNGITHLSGLHSKVKGVFVCRVEIRPNHTLGILFSNKSGRQFRIQTTKLGHRISPWNWVFWQVSEPTPSNLWNLYNRVRYFQGSLSAKLRILS